MIDETTRQMLTSSLRRLVKTWDRVLSEDERDRLLNRLIEAIPDPGPPSKPEKIQEPGRRLARRIELKPYD